MQSEVSCKAKELLAHVDMERCKLGNAQERQRVLRRCGGRRHTVGYCGTSSLAEHLTCILHRQSPTRREEARRVGDCRCNIQVRWRSVSCELPLLMYISSRDGPLGATKNLRVLTQTSQQKSRC